MTTTAKATAATLVFLVGLVGASPVAAGSAQEGTGSAALAAPAAVAATPTALNLYLSGSFLYQDPNYYACTSASAMTMLNMVSLQGSGGTGFKWAVNRTGATRDSMLQWERKNDTLAGGNGSDPHGWRNALNYYGWGSAALWNGSRIYDDRAFSAYDSAVKAAVRAIVRYRKPVGMLARAGQHAQIITGYYGLSGDPFAKDAAGNYTNYFTVSGFYVSDPLKSVGLVNGRISYSYLKSGADLRLRFRPYMETDSPYDDPYTAGTVASANEWYKRWVIVAPIR
jgi:hypothetical protein